MMLEHPIASFCSISINKTCTDLCAWRFVLIPNYAFPRFVLLRNISRRHLVFMRLRSTFCRIQRNAGVNGIVVTPAYNILVNVFQRVQINIWKEILWYKNIWRGINVLIYQISLSTIMSRRVYRAKRKTSIRREYIWIHEWIISVY